LPVTALNTSDATLTSIKISWTAGGTETSWNIEYGVAGFTQGTGTTIVVTNPFATITGLTSGTSYNVYVQANCGNGNQSTWTGHSPFYIGYCQPQGLTSSNKYYVSKFYTTGATTNLNYSASSGVGYVNQTFLPFSVKAGIPFKWSISASTGENYYFFIWVDWDNNGVFDEPAVYTSAGYEIAPKNVSYTVSPTQPAGTYRMRVATAYIAGSSVGPCGPNTHGNYVDFTLVVTCSTTAPTGAPTQTFINGQTLVDLVVSGSSLVWYSDATLTTTIPNTTTLVNGTTYYVVSEVGTCKSSALAIKVADCATLVAQPIGETEQIFTNGQTLADLNVTGDNLVWYSDVALTTTIPNTTGLVDNTTYYVVEQDGNCKSEVLVITVTLTVNVSDFDVFDFSYYPNPVNDMLHFSSNTTIESVSISNMPGQEVKANLSSDKTNLDMSNLATGNYFVKITIEGVAKTYKIIKN